MAWKAWENGTKRIIATPHFCRPDQRRRRSVQEYRRYVYLLQQGHRELGCGLELRAGMEVFATAELPKLLDRQEVLTLADSRYLLVEFYFDERGDYMDDALRLVPPRQMSLEQCLEFLADDELLEVTPKNLRIRKTILNKELRMKATHGGKKK